MATIIKDPQVGERPRRLVSRTELVSPDAVESEIPGATTAQLQAQEPIATAAARVPRLAQDIADGLPEADKLTEALTQANARTAAAEQHLAALQADIEQQREAAAAKGYEDGHARGLEQALETYQARIALLEELAAQLERRAAQALDEAEDAAIELVFAAVGKIVFGQLVNRDTVVCIVRNLKERLKDAAGPLLVRVSPDDLHALDNPADGQSELPAGLRLVADDRVHYGGCIIETDSGNLDARLEVQLQALLTLFTEVRQQGREVSA